jgi:hypothetical protein
MDKNMAHADNNLDAIIRIVTDLFELPLLLFSVFIKNNE